MVTSLGAGESVAIGLEPHPVAVPSRYLQCSVGTVSSDMQVLVSHRVM